MTNQTYKNLPSGNKQILGFLSRYNLIAIGIIVLLIVAYSVGKNNGIGSWNSRYQAFRDSAQAVATSFRDSVQTEIDSITKVAVSNVELADSMRRLATITGRENRRLRTQLASMPRPQAIAEGDLPPVCDVCVRRLGAALAIIDTSNALIANQQMEIDTLKRADSLRAVALNNLRDGLNRQTFVSDSLTNTIKNMPAPQPLPKLFGVAKVTPTQAFLGGSGLVLLLTTLFGGK